MVQPNTPYKLHKYHGTFLIHMLGNKYTCRKFGLYGIQRHPPMRNRSIRPKGQSKSFLEREISRESGKMEIAGIKISRK